MKICIPADTNVGLQSAVAANFGAARWLLVVDSDSFAIHCIDVLDPDQRDKPIDMDMIMCRGMTEHLYGVLREQGVPIYATRSRSVAAVLDDFRAGELQDLAEATCCQGTRPDCDHEPEDCA